LERLNKIIIIFLCLLIFATIGCSTSRRYKNKLVPSTNTKTSKNPYGYYIELTTKTSVISGEYIAFATDSIYIMTLTSLEVTSIEEIAYFNIVVTQTKTRNYAIGTALAVTPSLIGAMVNPEYATSFLTLSLVTALAGGLATLIEAGRKGQILSYPDDLKTINKSAKYARFPKGFPVGFDPAYLSLPTL
jgi:hypothetical protein